MQKINLKESIVKAAPYIGALALFLVVTMAYFSPLLEGRRIFQPDIVKWQGMAQEIFEFRDQTGKEPLWTNSMFGGMPTFQISTIWKNNIANFFHGIFTLGLPSPADKIFLYFVGFFILLLLLRVNRYVAMVGAIAFAFSSYNFIIVMAGHNTKAFAIAYMAPVLASIIYTFRGKRLIGALLFAIFMGLQLRANHLQITYYLAIIVLFWVFFEFYNQLREGKVGNLLKGSGLLLASLIIAIGINIGNFWGTYSYASETMRGGSELTIGGREPSTGLSREYITQWSYGRAETISLLIPNVKGGATGAIGNNQRALNVVDPQFRSVIAQQNQYWGDQPFTSGPVYVGVVVLFFFFLGLFLVKGSLKWGLLLATILSIMLAWGKNFMPLTDFFIDFVPGYNKFRAVSMTLVITGLTIPTLAFLAFNKLVKDPGLIKVKGKEFLIALGLTSGISLLFYLIPTTFFSFTSSFENSQFSMIADENPGDIAQINLFIANLQDARIAIFRADAIRSAIFGILVAGAVWLFITKKVKALLFVIAIATLVLADMWPINRRYLNDSHFRPRRQVENPFTPTPADRVILQDPDLHFRVFNRTVDSFNDTSTSWFHRSIGGYHGAKLQRYQDLIDFHISPGNLAVLNMLNTKYFILPDENRQPMAVPNPDALGNAWFVSETKIVPSADDEIEALNDFDPATIAIVHEEFSSFVAEKQFVNDTLASVRLTKYQPNKLVYSYNTTTPQIAVFSEIFYPDGWIASINGMETEHFRVNYILRALEVPAGQGEIVFEFRPQQYHIGGRIAFAFSLLLVVFVLVGIGIEIRPDFFKKKKQKTHQIN